MVNPHCKIGKVTPKNLFVLENPLDKWSKEVVEDATTVMNEERNEDARIDSVVVFMHYSTGDMLTYVNKHDSCKLPIDLMGEVIKQRVNSAQNRSETRQLLFEILEDC